MEWQTFMGITFGLFLILCIPLLIYMLILLISYLKRVIKSNQKITLGILIIVLYIIIGFLMR